MCVWIVPSAFSHSMAFWAKVLPPNHHPADPVTLRGLRSPFLQELLGRILQRSQTTESLLLCRTKSYPEMIILVGFCLCVDCRSCSRKLSCDTTCANPHIISQPSQTGHVRTDRLLTLGGFRFTLTLHHLTSTLSHESLGSNPAPIECRASMKRNNFG